MEKYDFNNKTFLLLENSSEGKANSETVFEYSQDGNLVTADYYGGDIKYGKIIALLKNEELHMRYQCLTTAHELKSGKAVAEISMTTNNKIKLKLAWEWLEEMDKKGISEYLEA